MAPTARSCLICLTLLLLGAGCVQRTLTINSTPPGAVVSLNNVEVGRTPIERDFIWYGTYDVELRKEGYEPRHTKGKVIAPWWQWPPIDFFAEFLPLHDHKTLNYALTPQQVVVADPKMMLDHAAQLKPMLESSKNTRIQDVHPATQATQFSF